METLGNRIRTIRKEQKMTLVDLAGSQMTKGMLSLIENDKANPSIENLQYIAQKLQIEIGSLTDALPSSKLRSYIDILRNEKLLKSNYTQKEARFVQETLSPIMEKLPVEYESGRIYAYYLNTFIPLKQYEQGIQQCESALHLYEKLSLYNEYTSTLGIKSLHLFLQKKYEDAYESILPAYSLVTSTYYSIDSIAKIEVLYQTASYCIASNRFNEAQKILEEVLDFCHETKIFYFYSHILRLAMATANYYEDDSKMTLYLDLLHRYTQFDNSSESLLHYHLYLMVFYNSHNVQPLKVIEQYQLFEQVTSSIDLDENMHLYALSELGKAYYKLERYEQALKTFEPLNKTYDSTFNHPYDTTRIQEGFAYKALLLNRFNEHEEAVYYIKEALNETLILPTLKERHFIEKASAIILSEDS